MWVQPCGSIAWAVMRRCELMLSWQSAQPEGETWYRIHPGERREKEWEIPGILLQDHRLQPTAFQNAFNACSRIVSFRAVRMSGSLPGFHLFSDRTSAHLAARLPGTQTDCIGTSRMLASMLIQPWLPETKRSRAKSSLWDRNLLPAADTTRFELNGGRVALN